MAHDVAEIGYSYGGFDWSGGIDTTRSWGSGSGPLPYGSVAAAGVGSGGGGGTGEEKVDFAQLQRVLCARCRVLVKDIQRARRVLVANALASSNTPAPLLISVPLSVLIPAQASIIVSDLVSTPVCDAHTEIEDEECQSADIQAYLELSSSTFFDQIAEGDAATETTAKVTIGSIQGTAPDSDAVPNSSTTHGVKAEERVAVSLIQPIEQEVDDFKSTEIVTDGAMEIQTAEEVTAAIEEKEKEEEQCNPDVEVEIQTQVSASKSSLDLGFDYDQLATLLVDSSSPLPCTPACTSIGSYNDKDIPMDKTIKMTENVDVSTEGVLPNGDSSHLEFLPLGASSSGEGSQPLPPPSSLVAPVPVGDLGDLLINETLSMPLSTTQPGQREETLSVLEQKSIINDLSGGITATPSTSRKRVSTCHTVTNMPAARCTDLNLGLLWRDIASQALTIPEPLIQREILDSLDSLLKDAGRFFLCDLGDEGQHWDEFMLLQKVIKKD